MLTKQQMAFLKVCLNITDDKPAAAAAPDFVPRAKGAQYEGEESKIGWRAANMKKKDTETEEEFQKRKHDVTESDRIVTRHYTEEETEAARLKPDEDGILRDATGAPAQGNNRIYAADMKTGDLVAHDGAQQKTFDRGLKADGTPNPIGRENTHHTSMLRGEDVAGAGTVSLKDGKIEQISNFSGHYKPQFEHLLQVVEHLISTGTLLDKTMVDFEGNKVEDTHPKAFKLSQKMKPILAELPADTKMLRKLSDKLDKGEFTEKQAEGVQKMIATLEKKIGVVEKYFAAMRTMGIGPSNAFDEDAKVDMAFIDKNMTGLEAHRADHREVGVEEFVTGVDGGKGKEAMRDKTAKDAMLKEFKDHAKEEKLQEMAERVGTKKGEAPATTTEAWEQNLEDINAEFDDIADSQGYDTDKKSLDQSVTEEKFERARAEAEAERVAAEARERERIEQERIAAIANAPPVYANADEDLAGLGGNPGGPTTYNEPFASDSDSESDSGVDMSQLVYGNKPYNAEQGQFYGSDGTDNYLKRADPNYKPVPRYGQPNYVSDDDLDDRLHVEFVGEDDSSSEYETEDASRQDPVYIEPDLNDDTYEDPDIENAQAQPAGVYEEPDLTQADADAAAPVPDGYDDPDLEIAKAQADGVYEDPDLTQAGGDAAAPVPDGYDDPDLEMAHAQAEGVYDDPDLSAGDQDDEEEDDDDGLNVDGDGYVMPDLDPKKEV